MKRSFWRVLVAGIVCSACGTGASTLDAGFGDAALPALNGCTPSEYVDMRARADVDRMVMVPPGTQRFDLPCVVIGVGQSVTFMWDFVTYPLAPGPAAPVGASATPVPTMSSGAMVEVAFPASGAFPFGSPAFAEMSGVVYVVP